jgi:hypothetical protein
VARGPFPLGPHATAGASLAWRKGRDPVGRAAFHPRRNDRARARSSHASATRGQGSQPSRGGRSRPPGSPTGRETEQRWLRQPDDRDPMPPAPLRLWSRRMARRRSPVRATRSVGRSRCSNRRTSASSAVFATMVPRRLSTARRPRIIGLQYAVSAPRMVRGTRRTGAGSRRRRSGGVAERASQPHPFLEPALAIRRAGCPGEGVNLCGDRPRDDALLPSERTPTTRPGAAPWRVRRTGWEELD